MNLIKCAFVITYSACCLEAKYKHLSVYGLNMVTQFVRLIFNWTLAFSTQLAVPQMYRILFHGWHSQSFLSQNETHYRVWMTHYSVGIIPVIRLLASYCVINMGHRETKVKLLNLLAVNISKIYIFHKTNLIKDNGLFKSEPLGVLLKALPKWFDKYWDSFA